MRNLFAFAALAILAWGCTDVGSFTTDPGECYEGKIVDAGFVRTGFSRNITLSLTLDTDSLADGRGSAGMMWTSDRTFNGATVSQMEELAHDSLSQFQFPGGRIRNYLVYTMATDGAPAMVVISLMENQQIEVRIMRPSFDPCAMEDGECDEDVVEPLFGVFRLDLDEECGIAQP